MKSIVILPTYQERKNSEIIYKKIRNYNPKIKILFIDDNSPDGTAKILSKLSKKDKNLRVIVRKRRLGIGSAHKFGIKFAVKKGFKKVVTMDADLTHDPKVISKMLLLSDKYDLIQTNRFFKKNSIKDWSIFRKVMTTARFYLIKYLLGLEFDTSGAFRCYNFKKIDLKDLLFAKDKNYSFFWESIYVLNKKKYSIFELPIKLPKRLHGSSKMRFRDWLWGITYLFFIYIKFEIFKRKFK